MATPSGPNGGAAVTRGNGQIKLGKAETMKECLKINNEAYF